MNKNEILEKMSEVAIKGWSITRILKYEEINFQTELMDIAKEIGTPVPSRGRALLDTLRPFNNQDAPSKSLSALVGFGKQPWHVDLSHKLTPARYLLLGCAKNLATGGDTEIISRDNFLIDEYRELYLSEPFLVKNGGHSFYSTLMTRDSDYLRFDPGCMSGVTSSAKELMQVLTSRDLLPTYSHQWSIGDVLIIDNWHMLHRRTKIDSLIDRSLCRICIKGREN
jgi:hypothetical protein